MDQDIEKQPAEDRFLPALAEALKEWFPEVGPRSAAVSEIAISRENIPTLPLILTAFQKSESTQLRVSSSEEFTMTDTFTVELWMPPTRVRTNNTETPFWNYYPYERIRDVMIAHTSRWIGPGNRRVSFRSLKIEADAFAVVMCFIFTTTFQWCVPYKDRERGEIIEAADFLRLCTPAACVPTPCVDEKQEDELCRQCP